MPQIGIVGFSSIFLMGALMTISLPGSSKRGLSGLFGRKKTDSGITLAPKKKLEGREIARLFDKQTRAAAARPVKPAKLNEGEKQDQGRISRLRGALYSNDCSFSATLSKT